MSESTGKTGRGIAFEIALAGSPTQWVQIANVTTINNSGKDSEEVDFTTLSSTGGFREFRQGFKDGGTIGVEFHFSPDEASHVEVADLWLSGDLFDWRINYVGAGWNWYEVGRGFVKNPGDRTIDVSNPVSGNATVRVTGGSSFVAA